MLIFSFKANAIPAPIWKLSPMRTLPGVLSAGLELMSSKDSSRLCVYDRLPNSTAGSKVLTREIPGVIDQTPLPVGKDSGTARLEFSSTRTSLIPNGSLPVGALTRKVNTASGVLADSSRNL
ncbi:hypothetical protein D3C72_1746640 [compost metagenome]